ncbi:glycoside hydrolase family 9 protein [candidate division KSB1 bacterium]|nr:glycoside hydrolase family 9 protein [candidate division KSB1 bacterium]
MYEYLKKNNLIFFALLFLIAGCAANESASEKFILVNQIGYRPEYNKKAFTNIDADTFEIVNTETGEQIYTGQLKLHHKDDPSTGETLLIGDFSDLKDAGNYTIRIGHNQSVQFEISEQPYDDAYASALKSFYFQRCGTELETRYAGEFSHPICHAQDATYHVSTHMDGVRDMTGGWHDAGDYGKYIVNAGITVGTMLMAYEHYPTWFGGDDIMIPESDNSIPDILDECRYELEWFLKMQHENGGVHHKVTRENFAPFIMPEDDDATRFIFEISSTATADYCAVMALASRIYTSFDRAFSKTCLDAALKAWRFLEQNPEIIPVGGFRNPDGVNTGGYGDATDRDERLWAAVELYITTGAQGYHEYYRKNYQENDIISRQMSWPQVECLAHLSYLHTDRQSTDPKIRAEIVNSLVSYCDKLVEMHAESGLHVLLQANDYEWGSNSTVMNRAILLIAAYEETADTNYLHVAYDQLHYILGVNIHGMTFITGVGDRYPQNIHQRQAGADNITEPISGFLAGGANAKLQDAALRRAFTRETPPARSYLDVLESYASNEVAINWNAPLLYVMGYLNAVR